MKKNKVLLWVWTGLTSKWGSLYTCRLSCLEVKNSDLMPTDLCMQTFQFVGSPTKFSSPNLFNDIPALRFHAGSAKVTMLSAQRISIQSNLWLRPPLVSNHLSSATSFPKYQKFPSQITISGTSYKRPPLVSNRDHFWS